jgi:hypothetical protein
MMAGQLPFANAADTAESADLSGFGKAKRCIFIFMWGGPSQLDTFDLKPNAPAEVRGEFNPVSTAVPGLQLCEHFKHLAGMTDRISVIRSMTHDDPAHLSSAHTLLTGHLPPVNKSDAEPPSDRDTPHIGSILAQFRESQSAVPSFVTMPWKALHPAAPGGEAPGQTGGWLGHRADPLLVTGDPNQPNWSVPALSLQDGLSLQRLDNRRQLLSSIESQQSRLAGSKATDLMTLQQQQAVHLLTSPVVKQAFDLSAESDSTRDRYGRHIHGQCVLLGRRLLEFGVPMVSINWHNDGQNFWDTHGNNFNRLKNDLIPPADLALTALLTDLADRNMLDDTLVVWAGEFGRRPQITAGNAGREHHPFCYSGLLAGGGIAGGAVYGSSDSNAYYPEEDPVSPHDFTATMLHALGIPATSTLRDQVGRPHRLYAGEPLLPLFS